MADLAQKPPRVRTPDLQVRALPFICGILSWDIHAAYGRADRGISRAGCRHEVLVCLRCFENVEAAYEKVPDVKFSLTGDAVRFAKANQMHPRQIIKKNRDGSFWFTIPEVPAEVVVPHKTGQ